MNPDVTYYPREAILSAAQEFETPFFLYKEDRIRHNCRHFSTSFKKYFPDFQALYAVKANSNPEVMKIIIDEGFEMDASSDYEAWLSKKLGVGGMFTGNYTTAETLAFAKECGFILNLDDESMIPFFKKIGVPNILSFRINPGIGDGSEESFVLAGKDAKYGVPFERAINVYKAARDLGVKRFGIHMMTGTNIPIEKKDYFAEIVGNLLDIVASIKKATGVEIEMMNIGGGFGVPYEPDSQSLDIEYVAKSVKNTFDEKCKEHNIKPPRLLAEPGRYITADAGWLVTRATIIKESYKKFIGIDASSNDMPRPSIYGAYHHASIINNETETEKVSIVGTICENNDQMARDRILPKCQTGDVVVIHNCGAHAFAMGHNYNGKLRHAEYLLQSDGGFRKIRRAETFEDLYRTVEL